MEYLGVLKLVGSVSETQSVIFKLADVLCPK